MNSNIFVKANQIIKTCDAVYLSVIDEDVCPHVSIELFLIQDDCISDYVFTV